MADTPKNSQSPSQSPSSSGIVTDPRDRMANQLFMRGHATMDEVLRASYGHWPPNGLNIIGQNDQSVKISDFPPERGTSNALAYGNVKGERVIELNKRVLSAPSITGVHEDLTQTALAHEATHILQRDHAQRQESTFGYAPGIPQTTSLESDKIAKDIWDKHADPKKVAELGSKPQHLISGRELQARIGQVIPEGYQKWGVMPQNREQLFVAMEGMGLKPPPEVMDEFKNSPTLAQNRKIFSGSSPASTKVIGELNLAVGTLSPAGQKEFWNKGIPGLYSDLIEMQGDKEGRSRFGLGDNPKLALRQNQENLKESVRKAPWENGVDADGKPAKMIDPTKLSQSERDRLREGLALTKITSYSEAEAWPPVDNPKPHLIVSGDDLKKLETLQTSSRTSPLISAEVREHTAHARQAGKASLPGMVMAGGTAALVAGTMAATGASASEIGTAVKDIATPQFIKDAATGDSAKVTAEVAGGALAVTVGAKAGAAVGSLAGPAGLLVGGAIGGVAGGLGLHEPAKKGIETAINKGREGVEWLLEKLDPGAEERQRKLDELLGSNVVGRVGTLTAKPDAAPPSAAPALKEDIAFKP